MDTKDRSLDSCGYKGSVTGCLKDTCLDNKLDTSADKYLRMLDGQDMLGYVKDYLIAYLCLISPVHFMIIKITSKL